ncbi:MAG: phosphoribosylaminoimidazolesuccinocarboxamide synthase [bacterium]|nr:phosphoribosylaminoimidazolesuccinocarboxamide synthase [bacterium]
MSPVSQTHLNLPLIARGKVRDIYELDREHLVIVTSDRLSAFDVVLPDPIPGKGAVLTKLTRFWMDKLARVVPNHLPRERQTFDAMKTELASQEPELTADHIEIVRKAKVFPIECVVRGYITGSGWKDYQKTGEVCGYKLPAGLKQCARLPEPLFTPSTKATTGHDENISARQAANIIGKEAADRLAEASLALYRAGAEWAEKRGILIADTKFEFGVIDGGIHVVDEVLTPDSSRFWPADRYEPGRDQPSFDKQIVRNHLLDIGWNKTPPAPTLPPEIISKTSQAYQEILRRLTE